jgi:hypothetical protein
MTEVYFNTAQSMDYLAVRFLHPKGGHLRAIELTVKCDHYDQKRGTDRRMKPLLWQK